MAIENRPYVGTWQLQNREVVRVTPDCLVYVNGNQSIPGCPSCGGRIELQKYITAITVDPSIEPVATASITLHVPRAIENSFYRDGQFLLRTGMEINIYFRGYFPVQGQFSDVPANITGGVDVTGTVIYPYYHVFHGVVTEASHEYAGGEHTASLSCSDILHFWGFQRMSTSGSYFGARPSNSGVKFTLIGHNFTAMTPYAIIYTLHKDVMGAAGGVAFALGNKTNASANSTAFQESLWSLSLLYWEKRFSQNFNSLRMFGMDGTLYNGFQQAFLGRLSSKQTTTLAKQFSDTGISSGEKDPLSDVSRTARAIGFDLASLYAGAAAEKDAKAGGIGININQMQGFVSDISNWGNVNLWESKYETKLEIVSTLKEVTNFEFYQDVDGDFVFKPPFYNLDTSTSRVYVIRDIDIISMAFTEAEPEATAIKATGGWFKNLGGTGLEGTEFGTRSEFIDHRLVAKYGWRQQTFETSYITDPRAMFFACANRLDLYNVSVKRASIMIPLRPELRPGYPVYIEPLDCFFYLQSFSHSFSFGGQCTTSLNLIGKRAKFYAPGAPPTDGSKPNISNIDLSSPWLPELPLGLLGFDGLPRFQGFPNVVMAFDPEMLNPHFLAVGLNLQELGTEQGMRALVMKAKSLGFLHIDEDEAGEASEKQKFLEGPFTLQTGQGIALKIPSPATLLTQVQGYQQAQNELSQAEGTDKKGEPKANRDTILKLIEQRDQAEASASAVQALIDAVGEPAQTAIEGGDETSNYLSALSDLKSSFGPGSMPGHYRYYSSSHPDPNMQGMKDLVANEEIAGSSQAGGLIYLDEPTTVLGFPKVPSMSMETIDVKAGIPIMRANSTRSVPTATHQIGVLSFAEHRVNKEIAIPRLSGQKVASFSVKLLQDIMGPNIQQMSEASGGGTTIAERFEDLYKEYAALILALPAKIKLINTTGIQAADLATVIAKVKSSKKRGVIIKTTDMVEDHFKMDKDGIPTFTQVLSSAIATPGSAAFDRRFKELVKAYGTPGQVSARGDSEAAQTEKTTAYAKLDSDWVDFLISLSRHTGGIHTGKGGTGLVVYVPDYVAVPYYTPVLPVSDHRGYEVIGSYRYGRGLTIEPGGNFERLKGVDRTANKSVEAVEQLILATVATGDISKAVGTLDPETAATLATLGGISTSEEALATIKKQVSLFEERFQNFSANADEQTQKLSVVNAAYGLADMGTHTSREVCSCKGAEADMLLQAFGQQAFISVDQPDEVARFVADRMLDASVPHKFSQDALRGQVLDLASRDLAGSFNDAVGSFNSGVGAAADEFNQATTALQDAREALAQDAADFPDDVQSDLDSVRALFNPRPNE